MFPFISRDNKLSLQQSHYSVLPEVIELFKPRYGMIQYFWITLQNTSGCEKLTWLILFYCALTFIILNTANSRLSSGKVS